MSWRHPIESTILQSEDESIAKQQQNMNNNKRKQSSCRNLLRRFPGRVPVIVERRLESPKNSKRNNNSTQQNTTTNRKRYKFLVPYDCSVGQFQWILRNKIDVFSSSSNNNNAIYLIVDHTLPHASCLIGELYRQYNDNDDGYLYIQYSDENTFGSSSSSSL